MTKEKVLSTQNYWKLLTKNIILRVKKCKLSLKLESNLTVIQTTRSTMYNDLQHTSSLSVCHLV